MRYSFIKLHQKAWPINLMCRVMEVSTSGYYDWGKHFPGVCAIANQRLDDHIQSVFHQHKGRYGSPRLVAELNDNGISCSENRVARRMQKLGLQAIQRKKFKVTTDSKHDLPVAPNLLQQDFTTEEPNRKWVSDITYIWTREGWLYLAVVMDLYSRAIIGLSINKRMTQQLVCDALTMALFRRGFPKDVIIHSDRGSQYCSKKYQTLLKLNKLVCSMSRKGCCYDNAAMESFFHTLKVELVYREFYITRQQARQRLFEYIETYYNRQRRHSTIDNQIPMQYELKNCA
ncbi:MAG: IS3 family transposase [Proteobacteria bacterium]|nr:IS3 family transposase [Pseudomonadota bacterium]